MTNKKTSIYDYDNDFAHYELNEKERKKLGQVWTPYSIIEKMMDKVDPSHWKDETRTQLDPTMGTGNIVIAKGTTDYSLKLNHDFVINGFNYLTENQKNEVAAASIKYSNAYKRKHIEMKKNLLFAINDAKLILKYL